MNNENNPQNKLPAPDPTTLTTDALLREIKLLREYVMERISRNREVCEESFNSVETQLKLIERQRVEQKSDTKAAVEAALTAQKEAVKEQTISSERAIAKSETATTKSIDQLEATFNTAFEGLRREISDIKDRVGAGEQQKKGGEQATEARRATIQPFQVVIISLVGSGILAVIVAVLARGN